jgi:hypothetical protein
MQAVLQIRIHILFASWIRINTENGAVDAHHELSNKARKLTVESWRLTMTPSRLTLEL